MKDSRKTKVQLLDDLAQMRLRIVELEAAETERKQVEKSLQESERKYRMLIENSATPVTYYSIDGKILLLNDVGAKNIGGKPDEFIGKSIFEVLPNQADIILDRIRRIVETKEKLDYETRVTLPSGDHWFLSNLHPITDANNEVFAVQAVSQNITERKQVEEALKESSLRLELALRSSNIGPWDWDLRTNTVYFSPEWKRQIGYEEHEITDSYEEWESRLHPDDRGRVLDALNDYMEKRSLEYVVEFRLRHKDGSYRWIYTRGELIHDANEVPCRMLGCHLDITDRKRAEEALQESERKYRMLFDDAVMSITLWDVHNWQIMLLNTSGARNLGGTTSDEFIGKTLPDILPDPEMIKTTGERFKSIVDTGTGGQFEDFAELPNGEKRWFKSDVQPMRDESGKIFALQVISEDISERKQAEEQLRKSEEKFRTLVENSPAIIYLADREARIQFINRLWSEGQESDVLGRSLYDFVPPQFKDAVEERVRDVFHEGYADPLESDFLTEDGSKIWLETRFAPIWSEDNVVSFMCIVTDITKRKQAEEALRDSEERYRRIADNATDVIWTMDMDMRLTYISPSIILLRGYSVEEALSQSVDVTMTPESLQIVMETFERE